MKILTIGENKEDDFEFIEDAIKFIEEKKYNIKFITQWQWGYTIFFDIGVGEKKK